MNSSKMWHIPKANVKPRVSHRPGMSPLISLCMLGKRVLFIQT